MSESVSRAFKKIYESTPPGNGNPVYLPRGRHVLFILSCLLHLGKFDVIINAEVDTSAYEGQAPSRALQYFFVSWVR